MANPSGTSAERQTLDYYERLPRSVREAVANARFDWALRPWLRAFETGKMTAKELCAHVQDADLRMSAHERNKVWGPDYPVLPGEYPSHARPSRRKA